MKPKNKSNLGFKKGMLGSLFQRKSQTLRKEKTKKKDRRNPHKESSPKRGWWTKSEKMEFWKGRQKEKQAKKTEKEENKQF